MKKFVSLLPPMYRSKFKLMSILGILLMLASILALSLRVQAQATCPALDTSNGAVTQTVSIPADGTYTIWSRIMAPDTTNNSYYLEIDNTTCGVNVGASAIPANTWTWVDYKDGNAASKVSVALTAGNHAIRMVGRGVGVKLDRILFLQDSCVPASTGDNCSPLPDTTSPTVSVTAPADGSSVSAQVNVSATASDNVGVAGVQFKLDGNNLGAEVTTAPYAYSWDTTTASSGSHTITAVARDAAGNTAISAAVTVTVSNTPPDTTPPTTSITAPASGATVSGTVNITASAADNIGVTKVEFYRDTTLLSSDTAAPYTTAWNTTAIANGSYSLTTKAFDAAGNITTSSAVSVTVNNSVPPPPDTTPPITSISVPAPSTTVSGTLTVTANAADNVGVSKVELYIDGSLAGTDVAAPFSFSWDTSGYSNGSHSLTTKAYDAANNVGSSAAVPVTINNVAPPGLKSGDVNGDGKIDVFDASILLFNFGKSGRTRAQGDLNGDGAVNVFDASILLFNWGK